MKPMRFAVNMLAAAIAVALAAPRAIGVGVMYYAANAGAAGQFGEGPPSDLKALHEATEKAFKAMGENIKKAQDLAANALEEVRKEGAVHAKTNDELKKLGETGNQLADNFKELKERVHEVEQKLTKNPAVDDKGEKSAGEVIAESDQYKAMIASKEFKMAPVTIQRKTIANATGQNQPLVPAQRVGGIIVAPERRLTVRDLLPQLRTSSNAVEFCRELVFTNNAGPQYDASSPTPHAEGAPKNESNITFELASSAVVTLAHWVGASRQVMRDAAQLAGYIDSRLSYGLKLEEEDELLNAAGANGELNGLLNQATAFTGGRTNQTRIDTILRAFLQVSLSEYDASAIVMHPGDWTEILLAKDSTGRYLFADPHSMEQPRIWGKPVVPTQSISLGTWLTGAFDLAAAIYDAEDITVRVSDSHADFFTKNLLAILCEERLALALYRPAAIITGSFNFAG